MCVCVRACMRIELATRLLLRWLLVCRHYYFRGVNQRFIVAIIFIPAVGGEQYRRTRTNKKSFMADRNERVDLTQSTERKE